MKLRVDSYAAAIARIQVPRAKSYDLSAVGKYFTAKGIPYALAAVIEERPLRGDWLGADYRIDWRESDTLIIEVTFRSETQGFFYIGES